MVYEHEVYEGLLLFTYRYNIDCLNVTDYLK